MAKKWVGRGVLAAAIVLALVAAHRGLPDAPAHADDEAFVPRPTVARLAAFGFETLVSDYFWMRAVQVVGSDEGARGRNRLLASLIDVVTSLDPWVDHPYRFAGIWLTDDEQAVRDANRFLAPGHPDAPGRLAQPLLPRLQPVLLPGR